VNKTFSLYTRGPRELVRGLDGRVSCETVLGEPAGNTSRCWSSYRHSLLDLALAPCTFSSGDVDVEDILFCLFFLFYSHPI